MILNQPISSIVISTFFTVTPAGGRPALTNPGFVIPSIVAAAGPVLLPSPLFPPTNGTSNAVASAFPAPVAKQALERRGFFKDLDDFVQVGGQHAHDWVKEHWSKGLSWLEDHFPPQWFKELCKKLGIS